MAKKYNSESIVLLAGGVGGAKLAEGLSQLVPNEQLHIYVNTADDFRHLGLQISPDLDSVMYLLAGISNRNTGWGRENETWHALETIKQLNGPAWFHLGDRDMGLHLERTRLLNLGYKLSEITSRFAQTFGIRANIHPMSDDPVRTMIRTKDLGILSFQEYFVKYSWEPVIERFIFSGIRKAKPVAGMKKNISAAKFIIFAPSNPFVSIDPILALKGIKPLLRKKIVIAVSPIIGGKAIKGPAVKMLLELGNQPNAISVAEHYGDLLRGFVIDNEDKHLEEIIRKMSIVPLVTDTVMTDKFSRKKLAQDVLRFCEVIKNIE